MSTENREDVYDLLRKYLHATSSKTKTGLKFQLESLKPKNSSHQLLEYDEYFYNKYDSEMNEEFDGFVLSKNQKFLKQFMSLSTKNTALLLFHGVGVGKTCSSIQIAQNFNKKRSNTGRTIVITSSLLVQNFKKELFDVSKLNDIDNTCLGEQYLKNIPNHTKLSKKDLEKQVRSLIKNDYEFYGYLEFTNEVEKHNTTDENDEFTEYIRDTFSNRLIIVDEVHNIREGTGKDFKKIPIILGKIYKHATNVRLLFLSATPMYNEASEIILLMNIMIPEIKVKSMFDENNTELTPKFKKQLIKFAKNHVSFMRGENPKTFPVRLFPSVNNDANVLQEEDYPVKDVYNEDLDEIDMNGVELVVSYFEKDHLSAYKSLPYKTASDKEETMIEGDLGNDIQKRIQLTNIYYPTSPIQVGKNGLKQFFNITQTKNKTKYELKEDTVNIFEKLNTYSPKMNAIINYVNKSEGIVIIYSRYIDSGIIPLALALESNGYNRYEEGNLWKTNKTNKGNYIILSGESTNKDKYINIAKSVENKDGDKIKVILMSSVATEGVDFKNVREIHILEPWHNMSLIEQVTGRGVRNFSHVHLPEEKRNTTIYLHTAMMKDDQMESVDFRMYRRSLEKQRKISMIERVLKYASIDCNLNKEITYYKKGFEKKDLKTSQGILINEFKLGDEDGSQMCNFTKCEYDCKPVIEKEWGEVKDPYMIEYDIDLYIRKIIASYEKANTYFMTYEQIASLFKNKYILKHALIKLTDDNMYTINKQKGKFIYKSNKYIFISNELDDEKMAFLFKPSDTKKKQVYRLFLKELKQKEALKQENKKDELTKPVENKSKEVEELRELISKYIKNVDKSLIEGMIFDKKGQKEQRNYILSDTADKTMLKESGLVEYDADENIISYWDLYDHELFQRNKDGEFVKASPIEKNQNNEAFFKKHKALFEKDNFVLGHIETSKKKNKGVFKMAQKESLKNNKRNTIIGTVCEQSSHINNTMMKAYLKDLKVEVDAPSKKLDLCLLYEYALRRKKDTFLRPRYFDQYKELRRKN